MAATASSGCAADGGALAALVDRVVSSSLARRLEVMKAPLHPTVPTEGARLLGSWIFFLLRRRSFASVPLFRESGAVALPRCPARGTQAIPPFHDRLSLRPGRSNRRRARMRIAVISPQFGHLVQFGDCRFKCPPSAASAAEARRGASRRSRRCSTFYRHTQKWERCHSPLPAMARLRSLRCRRLSHKQLARPQTAGHLPA